MTLPLSDVTALFESIAPLAYAEAWDNVGLLLEPERDRKDESLEPRVRHVMLLVDLTRAVLDEAVAKDVDLLCAYHPPIFEPLRRLRAGVSHERLVAAAARAGLAIYSPHTALDAAPGGVNDWLADALGRGARRPLVVARDDPAGAERRAGAPPEYKLVVFAPAEHTDALRGALAEAGAGVIGNYTQCSFELRGEGTFLGSDQANPVIGERGRLERVAETRLEMVCPEEALGRVAAALRRVHPYEEPAWDVYPLARKPVPGVGAGRAVELDEPATLAVLVERVKTHLGRAWVRVAASEQHAAGAPIRKIAVCAGSGGGLLGHTADHDLYLTGELRHHDLLRARSQGTSVVLCEHSGSERGFLHVLRDRLDDVAAGRLRVSVSESDRDPVELG